MGAVKIDQCSGAESREMWFMAEWKNIDDAPRDGTEIYAGGAGFGIFSDRPSYPMVCKFIDDTWRADFGDGEFIPFMPQPDLWCELNERHLLASAPIIKINADLSRIACISV